MGDGYDYAYDNPVSNTDPSGLCVSASAKKAVAEWKNPFTGITRRLNEETRQSIMSQATCGGLIAPAGGTESPGGAMGSDLASAGTGAVGGTQASTSGASPNGLSALALRHSTAAQAQEKCEIWGQWNELSGGAYSLQAFAKCSPDVRVVTVYVTILRMTIAGGVPRFERITAHAVCLLAGVVNCSGIPRLIPPGRLRKGATYTVIITGACFPGCAPHVPVRQKVRF